GAGGGVLGGGDGVLGEGEDGVLVGVGGHDPALVAHGVGVGEVPPQLGGDGQLGDAVARLVAVHLHETDLGLAVLVLPEDDRPGPLAGGGHGWLLRCVMWAGAAGGGAGRGTGRSAAPVGGVGERAEEAGHVVVGAPLLDEKVDVHRGVE